MHRLDYASQCGLWTALLPPPLEEDNTPEPSIIKQAHTATSKGPKTQSSFTTYLSQSLQQVPWKLTVKVLYGEYRAAT